MRVINLSIDHLLVLLIISWVLILILLISNLFTLFFQKKKSFRYPIRPLEEAHRGLTRMVEKADWLEGEKLILAVRHVAIAKEAIDRAAEACGKSNLGIFQTPSPLKHVLEEGSEILSGASSVLTFNCTDCGQQMSAMINFPKTGGRPESDSSVVISAASEWRTTGFTASIPCKRCKKLLSKKYLYDSLPV